MGSSSPAGEEQSLLVPRRISQNNNCFGNEDTAVKESESETNAQDRECGNQPLGTFRSRRQDGGINQ